MFRYDAIAKPLLLRYLRSVASLLASQSIDFNKSKHMSDQRQTLA